MAIVSGQKNDGAAAPAMATALCRFAHKRVSPLAAEPPPSLFVGDRSTTTIVCYYVVTNDGNCFDASPENVAG
jgi:hypothetical protein